MPDQPDSTDPKPETTEEPKTDDDTGAIKPENADKVFDPFQ